MKIERLEEFVIPSDYDIPIQNLLRLCFSEYPRNRTYYKQVPDFRYFVWEGQQLVGHMAVEHRMVNVAGHLNRVFGVVDLCVAEAFQDQKIASTLLEKLEKLGRKHNIDFIVLTAVNHKLYHNNGFQVVNNTCRWLMINEHQTLGVGHRRIDNCLMVKALKDKEWKDGLFDFLGYVF